MANKIKGGYKNVSLKGVDLIGASPEVDGLYDALINSYDKPIQLCNIVIDGAKKKNAFVQVKKDGNYVIVENLYGYKLTIGSDNAIVVGQAIPSELPSVVDAIVGDALLLDSQKKPVWGELKKLFFHPIILFKRGIYYLTMIIINNSAVAFTKASLISYVKESSGRFLVNGSYKGENYYLSPAYCFYNESQNMIALIGVDNAGTNHTAVEDSTTINFEDVVNNATTFEDNVNQIL